jgi:hypothetical protein
VRPWVKRTIGAALVAVSVGAGAAAIVDGRSGSAARVKLQQVDGGLRWYGQFSNPLPDDPTFFPIGVWFESVLTQGDIDKDKDAGINTYVELTDGSSFSLIRSNGMHAIHQQYSRNSSETTGWLLADEADMWAGPGDNRWSGQEGPFQDVCDPPGGNCGYTVMRTLAQKAPADGRLRYANYGKGVLFWETDGEAARFVNKFQDLVSTDAYWFTDNNICSQWEGGALLNGSKRPLTAAECHRASNYGAQVQRVRNLVSPRGSKPTWSFVEVGHPAKEASWPSIQPAEIRAAVWHSLIAGARGIVYFNHSFGGPCPSYHALREPCYAQSRATVRSTNAQIKALAPVLNAPFVTSGWTHNSRTKAMVKWHRGKFYVFAGSAGAATTGSFSIPCIGEATATVLDENRAIPVRNGSFTDSFADGNAIHIYRVDGGSTCGL